MDRQAPRFLLAVFALLFGVFFGVTVTRDGIGQVYGPLDAAGLTEEDEEEGADRPEAAEAPRSFRAGSGMTGAGEAWDGEDGTAPGAWRPASAEQTALSRLVGKTGELLRLLADGLIRLLVRLGEAVLS